MKTDNMQENKFCSHFSRWEFLEWNEMCHLAKPVNYGEEGGVICQGGKASDEIQGYIRLHVTAYRKWMKVTNGSPMRQFVLVAGGISFNKLMHILFHSGPPKPLLQKCLGSVGEMFWRNVTIVTLLT